MTPSPLTLMLWTAVTNSFAWRLSFGWYALTDLNAFVAARRVRDGLR